MKKVVLPRRRPYRSIARSSISDLNHTFEGSVDLQNQESSHLGEKSHGDDSPLRSHFGTADIRQGYVMIMLPFVLAVLIACVNHVVFSRLDGTETGSRTSQFGVTVAKNTFPGAVGLLLLIGLKHSLSQVALYRLRLSSHPLSLVNLITSSPSFLNSLSILSQSSLRPSILWYVLLTAITQAVALASLFVPGTLTVRQSPSTVQSLEVPTIDLNAVSALTSSFLNISPINTSTVVLSFDKPSPQWSKIISRAASSNIAPTWDPPSGCGAGCRYSFFYSAPALNCTELSKEVIWPSGPNATDSLLAFPNTTDLDPELWPFYIFNASFQFPDPNQLDTNGSIASSQSTMDMIYLDNFNTANTTSLLLSPEDYGQWFPQGIRCSYQNATYEATTIFSNNTQVSSTRVQEWHGPLPIGPDIMSGQDYGNMTLAFRSIAQAFDELFFGTISYVDGVEMQITTTQVLSTSLFGLTAGFLNASEDPFPTFPGRPESVRPIFNFSSSPALNANLVFGIQDLLGNVTLAFINENLATTSANVTVVPNTTEYDYIGRSLALIYGVVFLASLIVVGYGLICLRANGTTAIFDLEHIVVMTAASSALHESVTHPEFESILVRGVFFHDSQDGALKRVALDVE